MFASRPTFNAQVGIEVGMLAVTEGYWNSASDPACEYAGAGKYAL